MTNASDVEDAMYSRFEVTRLSTDLKEMEFPEQDIRGLLELVRAAAVIADYAIQAGRRRTSFSPPHVFGAVIDWLWNVSVSRQSVQSATLRYLESSVVTIAAFSPQSHADLSREKFVSAEFLDSPQTGERFESLVAAGRSLAETIGYVSTRDASRARRPWSALESLNEVQSRFPIANDYLAVAIGLSIPQLLSQFRSVDEFLPEKELLPAPSATDDSIDRDSSHWDAETTVDREASAVRADARDLMRAVDSREQLIDAATSGGRYRVWYGTDRSPKSGSGSNGFLGQRDTNNELHYGTCEVDIPRAHEFGSVGSSWWRRWVIGAADDRMRVATVVPARDEKQFASSLNAALDLSDSKSALVYVHGYATSFRQAAVRTAQMGFDLKIDGVSAFFSWPSKGQKLAYLHDVNSIESSESNFIDFLLTLATRTNINRINLIVHSMGNRLVARSLSALSGRLAVHNVQLGAIILAAPDIDVTLFKALAVSYPHVASSTTMYVSSKDKALALSKVTWRSGRAGFTPPVTVAPGINTIEVADVDVSRLGHGYYATAAPLLHDISEVMKGRDNPNSRLRIRQVDHGDGIYWQFGK